MGRSQTFQREYQIQQMSQVHHEIVRLLLLGNDHKSIAETLGITPACVSYTANSRIVMDKLALLRMQRDASSVDVAAAIRDCAQKCVEVLDNIMSDEATNPGVRVAAAKDLLDRAGYAAPKVIKTESVVAHLTAADVEDIKRRAIGYGLESGVIVDAIPA
jgi:hypothetical protein